MKKMYTLMAMLLAIFTLKAQVELFKDIRPGTSGGSPSYLTTFDGKVFFKANDGTNGNELWVTDGIMNPDDSTPGTYMIDLDANSSSNPADLIVYNNELYFFATGLNGAGTEEKGIYTIDGTQIIAESGFNSPLTNAAVVDGLIYSAPFVGVDAELRTFDGTTQNVAYIADQSHTPVNPSEYIHFNNKIFMYSARVDENDQIGLELYEYNAVNGTLELFKEFVSGTVPETDWMGNPTGGVIGNNGAVSDFTVIGDKMYFSANIVTQDNGADVAPNTALVLWETDGTVENTIQVPGASNLVDVKNLYAWNGDLYFGGDNGSDGDELYKYTPGGSAVVLSSVGTGTNSNHDPKNFCEYNGELYYMGKIDGNFNYLLHKTDGATCTTIDSNIKLSTSGVLAEVNGILIFYGNDTRLSGDARFGNELYYYDASKATAIGDTPKSHTFSIYPNPTQGLINVSGIESNTATYKLYNLAGACIERGMINNGQITLNAVNGVYMLEIATETTSEVQKVVIK